MLFRAPRPLPKQRLLRPCLMRDPLHSRLRLAFGLTLLLGLRGALPATSVIPISDAELYRRADVIVHGIVLSSDVTVDDLGRPETLTFVEPLAVLKGQVSGSLVLHQTGGT